MPFSLIRQDITRMKCDAIVNAANESLLGGGGVDGAIHAAAGPRLLEACRRIGGCPTGQARITPGFDLPSRYVIHTVGPVWYGGTQGEEEKLRSCYRSCLALALEYHCESVAFPMISTGVYGYPKEEALHIATEEVVSFLKDHDLMIWLVVFSKESFEVSTKLFTEVRSLIDDRYAQEHYSPNDRRRRPGQMSLFPKRKKSEASEAVNAAIESLDAGMPAQAMMAPSSSLSELLDQRDEGFTEMLLRLIDERGMKDSECYKKANVDRKLFSKIRKDPYYKPKKQTAVAFCIALELDIEESKALLSKAGYALSPSLIFDIIIEYCIRNHWKNIYEINEVLFKYDQSLLGV